MAVSTSKLQVEELLTLQHLDSRLGQLEVEQQSLDHGDRIERALVIRRARLESAEQALRDLKSRQRDAELELKALESHKHETSHKLYEGRITNHREAEMMERDLAMTERQRQRVDEQMMHREEDLERAQAAYEEASQAVEKAEKALAIVRKRYQRECKRIAEELASNAPERERLAARIREGVLQRYETIRRRNHNLAAVRIENGACGGCRTVIGGALLRRVLAGAEYVYCESCNRFLFPPAPEEEAAR